MRCLAGHENDGDPSVPRSRILAGTVNALGARVSCGHVTSLFSSPEAPHLRGTFRCHGYFPVDGCGSHPSKR